MPHVQQRAGVVVADRRDPGTPAIRSNSASGNGDWWNEVNTHRLVGPVGAPGAHQLVRLGAVDRLRLRVDPRAARHSISSSTPGSSSAAARPRGPQSITTRSAPAATARIAGPVSSTSPAESGRATSTHRRREGRRRRGATSR